MKKKLTCIVIKYRITKKIVGMYEKNKKIKIFYGIIIRTITNIPENFFLKSQNNDRENEKIIRYVLVIR